MADEERTGTTMVLDRPESASLPSADDVAPPEPKPKKSKNKKDRDPDEYEVEFETPFGKLEFEFEPKSTKERKDREKREKQAADAAKAAEKQRKKDEKQAAKLEKKGLLGAAEAPAPKRGSNLLPILIIFAIIAAAVIVAVWLFARPGDADPDRVPEEFLNDAPVEPEPAPQGFVAKAQARVRDAVRAGKQASRDTQREQQKKFEDLTGTR
jgi:hypothetical protein